MKSATDGLEVYLVGGAVRDQLLGLNIHERDWVVVGSTPAEMKSRGFTQVGRDFPVFLHPTSHEEYALARTERKSGSGYTGFEVHATPDVSLKDDLLRRDLTINALAKHNNGSIIDHYEGLQDLEQRLLRHVSPAFTEDPVRVLRIARFAARFSTQGFKVAPETQVLLKHMVLSGEVSHLTPERTWQELQKALVTDAPWIFFEVLKSCGALNVIFPEIDRLFGVAQNPLYHPEVDTGIHTMMVLQQACRRTSDPVIRFAALVHDLGKGNTPDHILPRHSGHEDRGVELIESLATRLRIPKAYRDLGTLCAKYHTHIHRADELRPQTVVKVLENTDYFRRPERFEQMLIACEADSRGRTGFEERAYPQADQFRAWAAAASRVDIKKLVAQGLTGLALKEAIHKQRIHAIRELKNTPPESLKC